MTLPEFPQPSLAPALMPISSERIGSRLFVPEGGGHLLKIEQPERFHAALAGFLDEISAPRAGAARVRARGEHA